MASFVRRSPRSRHGMARVAVSENCLRFGEPFRLPEHVGPTQETIEGVRRSMSVCRQTVFDRSVSEIRLVRNTKVAAADCRDHGLRVVEELPRIAPCHGG